MFIFIFFFFKNLWLKGKFLAVKKAFLTKDKNTQGVTSCWKSVHRISGCQEYQPDIRGKVNWYQEKTDQISIKYRTYFGRMLKNISCIYLNISQILDDSGQRVKTWKIAENRHVSIESNRRISRISTKYQPNIKAFCTVHRISWIVTPWEYLCHHDRIFFPVSLFFFLAKPLLPLTAPFRQEWRSVRHVSRTKWS